ncbi:MAG: hypothetical protein Q4D99_00035 [Bacillota bacterium]|nr:hypothetical protein [Bacillota bacterium]
MVNKLTKSINPEELLSMENVEKLEEAFNLIQKVRESAEQLAGQENSDKQKLFKVATTLTGKMFKMYVEGKLPTEYSKEDWIEVGKHVSEYAVKADDQVFSAYVFMFYSSYIDYSVGQISDRLSKEKVKAVNDLSKAIREKTKELEQDEIKEVDYVDDCLWICLEAMIKLLAGTIDYAFGFQDKKVAEAVMIFALEFGRLVLYSKEQALLTEYLGNQKNLNEELASKFEELSKELEAKEAEFYKFIDDAFNSDFKMTFKSSIELAIAAGVKREDLLTSVQETDAYFS